LESAYRAELKALNEEYKAAREAKERVLEDNMKAGLISESYLNTEMQKLDDYYGAVQREMESRVAQMKTGTAIAQSAVAASATSSGVLPSSSLIPSGTIIQQEGSSWLVYGLAAAAAAVGIYLWKRRKKGRS